MPTEPLRILPNVRVGQTARAAAARVRSGVRSHKRSDPGECMRHHSRWPTVVIFFVVGFASGCAESPNGEAAEASSDGATATVQSTPVMTVNQLMRGILFPL